MKALLKCPQEECVYAKKHAYMGAIVDPRTKQRLELVSNTDPFVAFTLDRNNVDWSGKRPDGVVLASIDDHVWVCFVEIKGRVDIGRAFEQLNAGAEHFAPSGRSGGLASHGDEHHDAWTSRVDVPDIFPLKEHRVVGLFVTFRMVPRLIIDDVEIAGKRFCRRIVQVSKMKPNWTMLEPRDLLRKAGLIS